LEVEEGATVHLEQNHELSSKATQTDLGSSNVSLGLDIYNNNYPSDIRWFKDVMGQVSQCSINVDANGFTTIDSMYTNKYVVLK
jgi:hypothetical protein